MGFGVEGLGFRVGGLGFRAQSLGCGVWGLGLACDDASYHFVSQCYRYCYASSHELLAFLLTVLLVLLSWERGLWESLSRMND